MFDHLGETLGACAFDGQPEPVVPRYERGARSDPRIAVLDANRDVLVGAQGDFREIGARANVARERRRDERGVAESNEGSPNGSDRAIVQVERLRCAFHGHRRRVAKRSRACEDGRRAFEPKKGQEPRIPSADDNLAGARPKRGHAIVLNGVPGEGRCAPSYDLHEGTRERRAPKTGEVGVRDELRRR
ncbi:MAG TPA: hypothetical protein VII82_07530 [Polyangiaceae bacterium]